MSGWGNETQSSGGADDKNPTADGDRTWGVDDLKEAVPDNDDRYAGMDPDQAAALAHAHGFGKRVEMKYVSATERATGNSGGVAGTEGGEDEGADQVPAPLWASNARRYEYKDEYGDVAPPDPELEQELFHDALRTKAGRFMEAYQVDVTIEGPQRVDPIRKFEDGGLHPVMMENLNLMGYHATTPIQAYTVPAILTDHDVIGISQTGSGKTAAYLVPAISKLMGKPHLLGPRPRDAFEFVRAEPLILVIVPSRELAIQIFDEARRLCYRSKMRPCVAYGGAARNVQVEMLGKGCDILIATTGRLIDFLKSSTTLGLKRTKFTIIDEADEMVDPDWAEDLETILDECNDDDDNRFLMFSATFPAAARKLARQFIASDHIRIKIGRIGSSHRNVRQEIIFVDETQKRKALWDLLLSKPPARTLIFVNNKETADKLDDFLYNLDMPVTSIHSGRYQLEREDALRAFRSGKCPILIATDVAARGIDVAGILHVINFDLPFAERGGINLYVHRIGRTARIGHAGLATSFYNDGNSDIKEALAKLLKENNQEIPEFLADALPEGDDLDFEDESEPDDDDDAGADGEGGAAGFDAGWGGDAEASKDDEAPAAVESGAGGAAAEKEDW